MVAITVPSLSQAQRTDRKRGSLVLAPAGAHRHHLGALVIGGEGGQAQFGGERDHVILAGTHERSAQVNGEATDFLVAGAAAHAIACLQHDDVDATGREMAGGGEAGKAGADDDDVGGEGVRHGLLLGTWGWDAGCDTRARRRERRRRVRRA
ncbi:hypothetical protein GCM10025876_30570 [Demequina litorisediminis]|uniref:Uncharacterized protein n=1 Tax=Demequina litorisediminis TaxID=1849022 RepID=A0ABQ6II80_9MICO|nr:hypothetical protein GCM10025876_30570 [Demequina litorisediminis]